MDADSIIRLLAKSHKYQTIYNHTKEAGMPIFKNTNDYSYNQIMFLSYLNFYFNIYTDIAMEYVIEKVLDNEIFEDAYLYYKRTVKNNIYKDKEKDSKTDNPNSTKWVIKRPKSEVK